jgi:hypothetical protein
MDYEAGGGWNDLAGQFESEDAALARLEALPEHHDWAQVVNLGSGAVRRFIRGEGHKWVEWEGDTV